MSSWETLRNMVSGSHKTTIYTWTTTKQSTTKLCESYMVYTAHWSELCICLILLLTWQPGFQAQPSILWQIKNLCLSNLGWVPSGVSSWWWNERSCHLTTLLLEIGWSSNTAVGYVIGQAMVWTTDIHDDVIKWKHFPRYWPLVWGIHQSLVNSPHKGQWRGALTFSLICAWINGWVNNGEMGNLRCHRAHYDVTVMGINHRLLLLGMSVNCWSAFQI